MLLAPHHRLKREKPTLVAVKIRLKRMGKVRAPFYRIVVADSRTKRDGRVIEEIGKYHPKSDPSFIEVDTDRAQYWLGVGAQPSEPVMAIFKVTGDWQKFKGEPAPTAMKVPEAKRAKADVFNDALKDAHGEPGTAAVTRKRSTKKAASTRTAKKTAPKAEEVAEPAADAPTAEAVTQASEATEAGAESTKTEPTSDTATESAADPEAATDEKA
jgi:small subunit ribosomal protein S16